MLSLLMVFCVVASIILLSACCGSSLFFAGRVVSLPEVVIEEIVAGWGIGCSISPEDDLVVPCASGEVEGACSSGKV